MVDRREPFDPRAKVGQIACNRGKRPDHGIDDADAGKRRRVGSRHAPGGLFWNCGMPAGMSTQPSAEQVQIWIAGG